MVRSLWTGATGMNAQQVNVDTIANNLSNVNTTGYKTEQNQFKSLLYQTLQNRTTSANGEVKPGSAQVGLGVRNAAITSIFKQGSLLSTEKTTDMAIEGEGFFAVRDDDGNNVYTRNGNFNWSLDQNNTFSLTTADGKRVLSTTGQPITFNRGTYMAQKIEILKDGTIGYPDDTGNVVAIAGNVKIGLYQFQNPGGLEKVGGTEFAVTDASGQPINEANNNQVTPSKVVQGYLEGSNVQVADEMVKLIVAQRAYEMNPTVITTTDATLGQANHLKK